MNNIDATTDRIIAQTFASIKADTISPDYFELSTDETIANYLNGMKGRKTYTMREINTISVAMVTGRERGISAAFRNTYGFNWSQAAEQNARYYNAINEYKTV
jgi:hypothetical protein